MKNNIFIKAMQKDGELHYPIKAQETRYKNFLKEIPEGANIEIFISVSTEAKGSNAQLARIHAMIRELASDLGYTFEEVKLMVKRHTGLCFNQDNQEYCKSFADCDKTELNLVIQECIRLGDFNGIQLR
jgi:hypothetical protein